MGRYDVCNIAFHARGRREKKKVRVEKGCIPYAPCKHTERLNRWGLPDFICS